MMIIKIILIFIGTVSLCIGAMGIFVPGLPTTPFLLISAGLYLRSSDKLYHSLTTNKHLGVYIMKFQLNKGITRWTKIYSISTMWIMITVSILFFTTTLSVKIIVSGLGIIGTIVMGFIIPTINNSKK